MRRTNGVESVEVDDVGEVGHVNAKLMRSAFNNFLVGRGLPASSEWNTPFGRPKNRKPKKEIDSGERGS